MASLSDFRSAHPEYDDLPDADLAGRLHSKFYSDLPRADFFVHLGVQDAIPDAQSQFAPGQAGTTGLATASGGPIADVASAVEWVRNNPQAVLDMLVQGGFTGLGIAAGAATGPAAPIAAPALGGTMSVIGKQASRELGRRLGLAGAEQPDALETIIDAGTGAVGPAVSSAARAARPLAGRVFGGGQETLTEVLGTRAALKPIPSEVHEARAAYEARDAALAKLSKSTHGEIRSRAVLDRTVEQGTLGKAFKTLLEATEAKDAAVAAAMASAVKKSEILTPGAVNMLTGATALLHNPVAAVGVFVGGHAIRGLHHVAAKQLLESDKFIAWALSNPAASTPKQIAGSLVALAAEKGLSADEREAVRQLQAAVSPPGRRSESRGRPFRDEGGRFAVGPTIFDGPKHGDPLL